MTTTLRIGGRAPDFDFGTPWDAPSSFYKATGNSPVILIFLRYIGCPVCQMKMADIKRAINRMDGKKVMAYVVLQSSPETVAASSNREDWPFTIVCDPDARIFQLYNVEPGGIFKYMHPLGLAAAIKAAILGHRHGKFEGMETQLPALFVITSDKLIIYAYYGKRIDDLPSLESLAAYIE